MKKLYGHIAALMLAAVLLLTVQCGPHRYPAELLALDSLADSQVDSAVVLMRRLAPLMTKASEADRRYYELLCIKTADKASLALPTDTATRQLVSYFENDGDRRLLPTAYYYAARIYRAHNDAPQALDYLQKADKLLGPSPEDHRQLHLKAVVNSQTGYLFSQQKLYQEALEAFKRAYHCDSLMNDTTGMIFNLRDLGYNSENIGERKRSLHCFELAVRLARQSNDSKMVAIMRTQMAAAYNLMGKYEIALRLAKDAGRYQNEGNLMAVYSV